MAFFIHTNSNYFVSGVAYAFFWWGLFTLYCIGHQLNRIRIYRHRLKRVKERLDTVAVEPFPGATFFHWLDHSVSIPFVTKMFPLKHIIGIALFSIVNLIFILYAPFVYKEGGYNTNTNIDVMDLRAVYIGTINCGFVFFLAQRNSILPKMSGLTFDELLPFHRIIAHITMWEFFPHFVWRMITAWDYKHKVKDIFVFELMPRMQLTGIIAMLGFFFIFIFSIGYIRRNHFEIFYYGHIVFMLIAIIFTCYHTKVCFVALMPGNALWIADRAIRTWNSWFVKSTFIRVDQVAPQTSSQTGISRILIENKRLLSTFKPGQYVFASMVLNGKKIWEYANWHPFTISEIFHLGQNLPDHVVEERVYGNESKEKGYSTAKSIDESISSEDTSDLRRRGNTTYDQNNHASTIASIHIKALGQKTIDVLESAAANKQVKVYLDGPYGSKLQYQDYPVLSLFATGIGITPALTIIKDVVDKRSRGVLTVTTEHIYLAWVIPNSDEIMPFMDMFTYFAEKCENPINPIRLSATIYVTRMQQGPVDLIKLPGFEVIFGERPKISSEMDKVQAVNANSRVWVHVCGSTDFTRTVANEAARHHFHCRYETFEF